MLVREFSEKGTFFRSGAQIWADQRYREHLVHKGVTHIPAAKIF